MLQKQKDWLVNGVQLNAAIPNIAHSSYSITQSGIKWDVHRLHILSVCVCVFLKTVIVHCVHIPNAVIHICVRASVRVCNECVTVVVCWLTDLKSESTSESSRLSSWGTLRFFNKCSSLLFWRRRGTEEERNRRGEEENQTSF